MNLLSYLISPARDQSSNSLVFAGTVLSVFRNRETLLPGRQPFAVLRAGRAAQQLLWHFSKHRSCEHAIPLLSPPPSNRHCRPMLAAHTSSSNGEHRQPLALLRRRRKAEL